MDELPLKLLKPIHNYFTQSNQSLCVVESCTGGLLSFWLTHSPGASQYFKGALVAYKTEVKIQLLGLCPQKIKKDGLCTVDCALSMAQGVKKLLKADWAVAVTGVAGPSKGEKGEPVGKVAFSVLSHQVQKSLVKQFVDSRFQGNPKARGAFRQIHKNDMAENEQKRLDSRYQRNDEAQNSEKRKDIQRQSAFFALNFLISEFK